MQGRSQFKVTFLVAIFLTVSQALYPLNFSEARTNPPKENGLISDFVLPEADSWLLEDTASKGEVRNLEVSSKYQVDILPIKTSRGTPRVTTENADEIIKKVSSAYEALSNGSVSLQLREVLEAVDGPDTLKSPMDVQRLVDSNSQAYPGFSGVLLIGVIVPNPEFGFAGIAVLGGAVMLINSDWSADSKSLISTIVHEFGHNLGLGHAGSAECLESEVITRCSLMEYGDYSDFMGKSLVGYVTDPPILRLSAYNRFRLKWIPEKDVVTVTKSGIYRIAPAYSESGTRIIVIPVYGQPGYAIEYRPAISADSLLSQKQLFIPGSLRYYPNIPSHGVQVRLLQTNSDPSKTMLPVTTSGPAVSIINQRDRQGLLQGEDLRLPDGTRVRVISSDPQLGAEVELILVPDLTAPLFYKSLDSSGISWELTGDTEIVIRDNRWKQMAFYVSNFQDDRLISYVSMEVDGREVARTTVIKPFESLSYTPNKVGVFDVKVTAVDSSGNMRSFSQSLVSTTFQHKKSVVEVKRGTNPSTSLEIWYPRWTGLKYTFSNLSSGTLGKTRRSSYWNVLSVNGLRPGEVFTADVIGVDKYGQTDGGQQITGQTLKGKKG